MQINTATFQKFIIRIKEMSIFRSFKGGIHPPYNKEASQHFKIEEMPAPNEVFILLQQHLGKPAKPIVEVGDKVKKYQLIAEATGLISANIHSSVSGSVSAITQKMHPNGTMVDCIVIKNDMKNDEEELTPSADLKSLSANQIQDAVKKAGIIGCGGAAFPTHVKITPQSAKPIDTIIVNLCECEPYLTSDHRLSLEQPESIIYGARAVKKATDAKRIIIAIEDNKPDTIISMKQYASEFPEIDVASLHTKYPQGSEKQLIEILLNKEVPAGKLPLDLGVTVVNVGTCVAIANALQLGKPLVSQVATIGGDAFDKSRNYDIPIGTPVQKIVDFVGGFSEEPEKVIIGGPMMGLSIFDLNVPTIKATGAILAFKAKEEEDFETNCIRCGRCIQHCPMLLSPTYLHKAYENSDVERLNKLNVMDCIECGCCSYGCPAKIHLLQYIKLGKDLAKKKEAI